MGRVTQERKRIYKETVEEVLKKYRLSKGKFCEDMGHSGSWFGTTLARGYYDIAKPNLRMWAMVIGCTEDELTAIPVSPQGKAKEKQEKQDSAQAAADNETLSMLANLMATMLEGFSMLHTDIRNLIETMDKYWKPTEPKYEIREREQP